MKDIAISVIIPTYNRKKLVLRCLEHLAASTLCYEAFEVIVVDDCSNDGTDEVLNKYNKIKNFRYLKTKENTGGASIPRNIGIQNASGKYVYFIDADDYIESNTLEDALSYALLNNSDILCMPMWSDGRSPAQSMYKVSDPQVDLSKSKLIRNLTVINKLIKKRTNRQ